MDTSAHKSDFVNANGIRIHYLDWGGNGPVLLFLTGLGLSAHIYDKFAPRFVDKFHVIALTRRGHGDSDYPETGYDVDTLTEEQQAQVIDFYDNVRPLLQHECIEQFRRSVPHARIVIIPKGHHYCFIKHEELVFDEMRKFLLP